MGRITLFCFYDIFGFAGTDTIKQLSDLRRISDYLVVVVNGELHNCKCVEEYSDRIIFRPNRGYDAGAYKTALCDGQVQDYILQSDELLFCNNTFWGPIFDSYESIMQKMKKSNADFWGLVYYRSQVVRHIQSYFMCFRKKIIENGDLNIYMSDFIDENTTDYNEVCCLFEIGLFEYLVNKGYRYDALIKQLSSYIFVNPYQLLVYDRLPIIKKKCFAPQYYNKEKGMMALAYVHKCTDYDVKLILQYIDRVYGIHIDCSMLEDYHIPEDYPKDLPWTDSLVSKEKIISFAENWKSIYIYGAGGMGKCIFYMLRSRVQIDGFIVSDNQAVERGDYKGVPIFRFSEIGDKIGKAGIIVAMVEKNASQVRKFLRERENVLYMW